MNGLWKFNWAPIPEKSPQDFFKQDFDVSGWDDIPVPANWELEGYGMALSPTVPSPFIPVDPPNIPKDDNPVGCYKKEYTL